MAALKNQSEGIWKIQPKGHEACFWVAFWGLWDPVYFGARPMALWPILLKSVPRKSPNAWECCIKSLGCHFDIWNIWNNLQTGNKNPFPPYGLNLDSRAPRLDLDSVTCTCAAHFSENNLRNTHFSCIKGLIQSAIWWRTWGGMGQGRIPSIYRHRSTVPGQALVKWLDTLKEAIHQPVVFLAGRHQARLGESVMLWLPFIKRQGCCGSGSTGAAAINKQTKREAWWIQPGCPVGEEEGGLVEKKASVLQTESETLTKKND